MTKAQREAIERHGRKLLAIFPSAKYSDPVKLCGQLRMWENRGQRLAEQRCNDPMLTEEHAEAKGLAILAAVKHILGDGPEVFLNGDPRGYALKIESETAAKLDIVKDWGGYGIIAPEFNREGF